MEGIKPEIAEKVRQLEQKFKNSGQDLGSYLTASFMTATLPTGITSISIHC